MVVNSETLALMMVDYEGGMNLRDVGEKYGMCGNTARRILAEAGVEIKESRGGWANSNPICSCGHKNPAGSKFAICAVKASRQRKKRLLTVQAVTLNGT